MSYHLNEVLMPIIAAADTGSTDFGNLGLIGQLVQFGFIGLVLIDIIGPSKFITTRASLTAAEAAHERYVEQLQTSHAATVKLYEQQLEAKDSDMAELKQANGQLRTLTEEKLLPAVVSATAVNQQYVAELARRGAVADGR